MSRVSEFFSGSYEMMGDVGEIASASDFWVCTCAMSLILLEETVSITLVSGKRLV